MQLNWVE